MDGICQRLTRHFLFMDLESVPPAPRYVLSGRGDRLWTGTGKLFLPEGWDCHFGLVMGKSLAVRRTCHLMRIVRLDEGCFMSAVKEAVLELTKQLPEECTWDDVMYRIYVRQKIEAGIQEADAGHLIPHEEVFDEFRQ